MNAFSSCSAVISSSNSLDHNCWLTSTSGRCHLILLWNVPHVLLNRGQNLVCSYRARVFAIVQESPLTDHRVESNQIFERVYLECTQIMQLSPCESCLMLLIFSRHFFHIEHPALWRNRLVHFHGLILNQFLSIGTSWFRCTFFFGFETLAVLLKSHVAFDVFEDQLILHACV